MAARTELSTSKQLLFGAIAVAILLATIEAVCAAFLHGVIASRAHFLIWNPDLAVAHEKWVAAAGDWDPELGWPASSEANAPPRDSTGAKANPDFLDGSKSCASAYGDSFVWGDDIPLPDGWIEQLSRKLGCRVANYGVNGYGTDQAYIRFTRMSHDEAPVTLLGIFPENIVRNVNQYRQFIGHDQTPLVLKGRFVLNSAERLEWIHRPPIDEKGFIQLLRNPASVIPHEYLLPDTRDGPVTLQFPYTLSLARLALMPRLWTRLTGTPSWAGFYRSDHPAHALELTAAIAEAFVRDAEKRGQHGLVVMLPAASSFRARENYGQPEYQPLVTLLVGRHVDVFDPAAELLSALGKRSYCALYAQPEDCNGHFGVFGSGIVADVVMRELKRRGWLK